MSAATSGVTNPYGKVHATFWSSETTGDLSDAARLLALYLMTCPHRTIAGVFRLPMGYAAEDLRWGSERVSEGFRELSESGFATYCERTKWVWVVKHLDWNPPENPNQVKACAKVAASIPPTACFARDYALKHGELLGLEVPPEPNGSETLPKGLPNQQQQQQQQAATAAAPAPAAACVSPAPQPIAEGSPTPPAADAAHTKGEGQSPKAETTRGTRLAKDWALPASWGHWALAEFPWWGRDTVLKIADNFRDHWVAQSGKDGVKLDWEATWRNWCRSTITQRAHPKPRGWAPAPASPQAASEAQSRLAEVASHLRRMGMPATLGSDVIDMPAAAPASENADA